MCSLLLSSNTLSEEGKMIRFVRTSSIAQGKLKDALAVAKQIAEHISKKHGVQLEIMMPVGGNPFRIAWRAEYPSLTAFEDAMSKVMADAQLQEIIAKGSVNFIAGSANDVIWRTV